MSQTRSSRTRLRRVPANGRYDRASIHRALDRGRVAHISFVSDGQPYCIPTFHARVGEELLIHGSTASRMIRLLSAGAPACVTVTTLDGLVMARSVFEHGANYESVVILGRFRAITGDAEKVAALQAFTDAFLPGRWSEVRAPSRQELKATSILAMALDEASVKVKTGPPDDDDSPDAELDVWAGVIPIVTGYGTPQASPVLRPGMPLSPSVTSLINHASL